jgi:hypothetical protein
MATLRDDVDSVIDRFREVSKSVTAAEAPVDLHGAHPFPSLLTKSFNDIKNAVDKGPPFTLSDLVSAYLTFSHRTQLISSTNSLRVSTLRGVSLVMVP